MFDIKNATMSEMVAFYNAHSDKPVKRFSDRATAERRVSALVPDEYTAQYGTAHCPSCGVHLSNGVLVHGVDEQSDGSGRTITNTTHEYYCMGCGHEFGPAIKSPRASSPVLSAAIRESWKNPATAQKRSQRSGVKVDGVWHRSVGSAFRHLGLPMNEHIKFRMQLKSAGKLTAYGYRWEVMPLNY